MKKSKRKTLLNCLLLSTGAYALYALRDRLEVGNLRDRARERYETASRRARKASDALRGKDRYSATAGVALLVGVGLGIGVGILVAPASGEETRADVSEKMKDLRARMRERSFPESKRATGTYGEGE